MCRSTLSKRRWTSTARCRPLSEQRAGLERTERAAGVSINSDIYYLERLIPYICTLDQIHDGTLEAFVRDRKARGLANKTINLGLTLVRRMLNLAARSWRDENGKTWLETPPLLTLLPLIGHQRERRPITWAEQRELIPRLPDHLARMVLLDLNTGVRDEVVCGLKWEWEIAVPELGISVFEIPRESVKGRKRSRVLVWQYRRTVDHRIRSGNARRVCVCVDPRRKEGLCRRFDGDHEQHGVATGEEGDWYSRSPYP